jgi:hypothetical protein
VEFLIVDGQADMANSDKKYTSEVHHYFATIINSNLLGWGGDNLVFTGGIQDD